MNTNCTQRTQSPKPNQRQPAVCNAVRNPRSPSAPPGSNGYRLVFLSVLLVSYARSSAALTLPRADASPVAPTSNEPPWAPAASPTVQGSPPVDPPGASHEGANRATETAKRTASALPASPDAWREPGGQQAEQLAADHAQMAKAREGYRVARSLLGGEHVSLSTSLHFSWGCRDGGTNITTCGGHQASGGLSAIISVPLIGAGGGHGIDWYPVLHTEDESQAFEDFQRQVLSYADAMDRIAGAGGLAASADGGETLRRAARALFHASGALASRAVEDDASYYESAATLKRCLQTLLQDAGKPSGGATPSSPLPFRVASTLHALDDSALVKHCRETTAKGATDLESLRGRIHAAVQALRSYRSLLGSNPQGLSRHNLLVGPALSFPITQDPTQTLLWGLAAEVGWRGGLRVGLGGGLVASYAAPLAPWSGYYVNFALSGAFGDELLQFIAKAAH